jgi:hypothetical protein
VICRASVLALSLCSIEFAPGTFVAGTRSGVTVAQLRIVRDGRVIAQQSITLRPGRVARPRLPLLARGRYTLRITVGRGGRQVTLDSIRFTVR